MTDKIYFGIPCEKWYQLYENNGIEIFENRDIDDSGIIQLLGRCCIGREMIIPSLKQAGWSLERLINAEKKFGIDPESLCLVAGEYSVMDEFDYMNMKPFEVRMYINSNYNNSILMEKGEQVLKELKPAT